MQSLAPILSKSHRREPQRVRSLVGQAQWHFGQSEKHGIRQVTNHKHRKTRYLTQNLLSQKFLGRSQDQSGSGKKAGNTRQ